MLVCACLQPQFGQWVHWNAMIAEVNEEIEYSKKTKSIQDTLVPTLDTVRYQYMMDLCIKQNRSPAICSA